MKWIEPAYDLRLLNELGISYVIRKIKVESVHWEKRALDLYQTRITETLHADTVDRYAITMLDGAEFPMIVFYKKGEKYHVVHGRHRMAAVIEAQFEEVTGVVIEVSDEIAVDDYSRRANLANGLPESKDEMCLHAMHRIEKYGGTLKEVAPLFGLSERVLGTFIRNQNLLVSISGVRGVEKLSSTTLTALNPVKNIRVASEIAGAAIRTGAASEDVRAIAQKVNRAKDELGQLNAVRAWEEGRAKIERATRTKRKSPGMETAKRVLRGLAALCAEVTSEGVTDYADLQLSGEHLQEWQRLVAEFNKANRKLAAASGRGDPRSARGRASEKRGGGAAGGKASRKRSSGSTALA